ncbi:MAG: hypothetical protein K2O24_01085 [Muribaculaceae bacterium]|nr:hypothetical protein [Muribaculaceae bacterium]
MKKDTDTISLTPDQMEFFSFMAVESTPYPDWRERFQERKNALKLSRRNAIGQKQVGRHSPRAMIRFLSLFSKDEDFKWYTHRWDQSGVTLETLMQGQKAAEKKLKRMTYGEAPINFMTYNHVWNFITFQPKQPKPYPWCDNKGTDIYVGWYSIPSLHEDSPNIPVEDCILPDGHIFIDYIRLFKGSIEFRTDLRMEDRFSKFIRNAIKTFTKGAVNVEFTADFKRIGYDLSTYCDIPAIYSSLHTIFDWIVKFKTNGSEVLVDLVSKDDRYDLIIFHKDSYFYDIKKLNQPSGDFAELRKRLFSVCNFTMEGDLKKEGISCGSVKVYGLDENTTDTYGLDKTSGRRFDNLSPCEITQNPDPIGGVRYTLGIYKS